MKEPTQQCEFHLEALREKWLAVNKEFQFKREQDVFSQSVIQVDGVEYTETVYAEKYLEDKVLVVFELSKSNIIGSTHHCLGIEIGKDQSNVLLSQEDLWNIGIP